MEKAGSGRQRHESLFLMVMLTLITSTMLSMYALASTLRHVTTASAAAFLSRRIDPDHLPSSRSRTLSIYISKYEIYKNNKRLKAPRVR